MQTKAQISNPVANPANGRSEVFAHDARTGVEIESCWLEDWREMVVRLREEDGYEVVIGPNGKPLHGLPDERI